MAVQSGAARWPVVGGIALVRLYGFGMLFLFFLHTGVRRGEGMFLFERDGQSRAGRWGEIEERFRERLAPFDGQFYLDIANRGYRTISPPTPAAAVSPAAAATSADGTLGNYAFFPLLPAVLAALRLVCGDAYLACAIGLTLVAGVVGAVALWRVAERCRVDPLLAVAVLLCFPSAPFQYVLYTEAWALCFSALALLHALERRVWPATCWGLLAGLSRPQGALVAIVMFVEFVVPVVQGSRARRGGAVLVRAGPAALAAVAATAAPLGGFFVMAVTSAWATGSPFAFLTVQATWGRTYEAGGVLRAFGGIFGYDGPPLDILGLVVALGCLPVMWKRLPRSLFLYGLGAVVMPLVTGSILSLGRFMSVSLPHLLAVAVLLEGRRRRPVAVGVLAVFVVLQAILVRGLLGWYFVG